MVWHVGYCAWCVCGWKDVGMVIRDKIVHGVIPIVLVPRRKGQPPVPVIGLTHLTSHYHV